MSGLERYGFDLPEAKARGREKVGKADVEVHRAGPNEFSILRTNAKGKRTEERARLVDVREVWAAITDIVSSPEVELHASGSGDLAKGFPLDVSAVLSARQIMTRLRERASEGSAMRSTDVSAWQGGENRARIYFPLYYRPVLVLAGYYRVVERPSASSRFVRVLKPWAKLDEVEEKKVEGTTLGDDWGKETI